MQAVASRVAEEMDVKLGEEVGYTIRFEDITNEVGALSLYLPFYWDKGMIFCFIMGIFRVPKFQKEQMYLDSCWDCIFQGVRSYNVFSRK